MTTFGASYVPPSSTPADIPAPVVFKIPYENPVNDLQRKANYKASCQRVVGAVWDSTPRTWWIPVGLEYANDPANPLPQYKSPFFGADREYENEDEGWTYVSTSRRRRINRRRRQVRD
jgi:hypothetical protein